MPQPTILPLAITSLTRPAVRRSALVGLGAYGAQKPVLCIEREPGAAISDSVLCSELLTIASQHRHTRQIQIVLFHPGFPVDIRHNAKIGREQLTAWATKRLAKRA